MSDEVLDWLRRIDARLDAIIARTERPATESMTFRPDLAQSPPTRPRFDLLDRIEARLDRLENDRPTEP